MQLNEANDIIQRIDLDILFVECMKELEKEIIEFNIGQLYKQGVNSDGKKLKRKGSNYKDYSAGYKKKKNDVGLYQGYIDLHYSGDFYDSWKVDFNEDSIDLKAGDVLIGSFNLTEGMREWYKNFEGLTKESKNTIAKKYLLPILIKKFKEQFNV